MPEEKKKKKKRHNKDALQEKKRQKIKDVQAQLDDPDMPVFSNVGLSDNMNFVAASELKINEVNEKKAEKKKRKKGKE